MPVVPSGLSAPPSTSATTLEIHLVTCPALRGSGRTRRLFSRFPFVSCGRACWWWLRLIFCSTRSCSNWALPFLIGTSQCSCRTAGHSTWACWACWALAGTVAGKEIAPETSEACRSAHSREALALGRAHPSQDFQTLAVERSTVRTVPVDVVIGNSTEEEADGMTRSVWSVAAVAADRLATSYLKLREIGGKVASQE